jgi:putative copper resistance protein D
MIALNVIFKYLSLIGSFATIGTLLAMGFLLADTEGKLSSQAEKLRRLLWGSGLIWSVGSLGTILFTLASILDQPVSVALDATMLRSFITQITLGQYLLFQAIVALLITSLALRSTITIAPQEPSKYPLSP